MGFFDKNDMPDNLFFICTRRGFQSFSNEGT